jgi:hypothetical protein
LSSAIASARRIIPAPGVEARDAQGESGIAD